MEKERYEFDTPTGCVSVKITISANGAGPFYVDDVSLLQYSADEWEECTDVMASPDPQWGYGIKGSDPMNLVASTGMANFVLDNVDGEYSPENASRIVGFEEGMGVKITTQLDADVEIGDAGLLNGSFEDLV